MYIVLNSVWLLLCFRQVLLCSLYEIYKALEEELDRNSLHPAVAPIYFPQELARLESLERDLEHFFGSDWRKRVIVPAATHRYEQRLRKVSKDEDTTLKVTFWVVSLLNYSRCFKKTPNISDWQREPGAAGGPRLHPLSGRSIRRSGAGEDYPEIPGAGQQRGAFVFLLPWRDQPQPLQAAVQGQDEQHRADGGAEAGGAAGGCGRLRAEHPGESWGVDGLIWKGHSVVLEKKIYWCFP